MIEIAEKDVKELDGAKPFEVENGERFLFVQPCIEPEQIAQTEQVKIREEKVSYPHKTGKIFVRSWDSARMHDGRVSQPWHERLLRIRDGEDPRF